MKKLIYFILAITLIGCSSAPKQNLPPKFTFSYSEYFSWSIFGVAGNYGLIDPEEGKLGEVEKKWNVDIVLVQSDYDTCITQYASGVTDGTCLTTLDALSPSLGRSSLAVCPTSTSSGADACIVTGINNIDELKTHKTYGLAKSVSQYVFVRNLVKLGKDPKDYQFESMDPAVASQAMQTNQNGVSSIMVWQPFILETLNKRTESKVLFDSKELKEEVIDCIILSKDSVNKEGGERFACAIIDAFYQMNQKLLDPNLRDKTLVLIGTKFSSLGLDEMKTISTQTLLYKTPEEGISLFDKESYQNTIMPLVADFCVNQGLVPKTEKLFDFEKNQAPLTFTTKYMKKVLNQ